MSKLRERLAAHRQRLILQSAALRGEVVTDLSVLERKVAVVSRILSLVSLAQPLLSFAWRRWRR